MQDKLSITIDGKDRELFMSYGLLNDLTKVVGSPEVVPGIGINADLREEVLRTVLAERKPSGKVSKPVEDIDDIDVSIKDVETLLDWVSEHTMAFFVRSLGKMVQRVEENKEMLEGLKSSVAGLAA